jgi:ribose/xylose/arabinose/galactoside ABC-type transport system permease subunit
VLLAATAATLAAALLVGVLHALLITRLDLPPFIATLGTLIGLRSLGRVIAQSLYGSDKIAVPAPDFRALYNATWKLAGIGGGVQIRWVPLCVFLVVAVGAIVLMRRTILGRHLYALGGNEEAARLSGIRTDRLKYVAYCLGAVCSGMAGILYAAREGQGNSTNMGMGYELNAIAAAVVGGASLRGGVGTMSGTILGALFLTLVVNGIPNIIKIESTLYEGIVVGVVVILAVAVNQLRGRKFGS